MIELKVLQAIKDREGLVHIEYSNGDTLGLIKIQSVGATSIGVEDHKGNVYIVALAHVRSIQIA